MIIDCIGCLHGHFPKLNGGDLLIVTGDLTASDTPDQYIEFNDWLSVQDYRRKIVIAGNHDRLAKKGVDCEVIPGIIQKIVPILSDKAVYLQDSGHDFEGLKIWGIPWTLTFKGINPHCTAFTCTEEEMQSHIDKIPSDIDILVSHGPPYMILDELKPRIPPRISAMKYAGSTSLRNALDTRLNPKLFVCSHIHEAYGKIVLKKALLDIICVNASIINADYKPINKPIRVKIQWKKKNLSTE